MTRRTPRRRRLEAKTDYKCRLSLLSSGKPRLVLRRTNRYIIAQIIESDAAQDRVAVQAVSGEPAGKGWPKEALGSLRSRSAAYLTGYLLGVKAKGKFKELILDIGMNRNVHKSRLYSALKGALDAGLHIPHSQEAIPSDEMIKPDEKFAAIFIKIKQGK